MMKLGWVERRRSSGIDPDELDRQTEAIEEELEREAPRMAAIATYLERRRMQNGFGNDFEYTLRPRRA